MGKASQAKIDRINQVIGALFMPKANPKAILREKYSNETKALDRNRLAAAQEEIEAVEIPVPEDLNDRLIAFAVMGSSFTDENFKKIGGIMLGSGSTVTAGLHDYQGTGLCFFSHNLIEDDERINTHSSQLLIPQGRKDVKNAVASGDSEKLKGYLSEAFRLLYIQAVANSDCDRPQYSNATEQLIMLTDALKEKNLGLSGLGATDDQLKMVDFLRKRQALVRRYMDISEEIEQAETNKTPMNPEFQDKIYEFKALEYTIKSFNKAVQPFNDIYSSIDFDTRDLNLAKRPVTGIENLIGQAPDEFVREIKRRISSNPNNAYNGKESISNYRKGLKIAPLKTYFRLEDYDRQFLQTFIDMARPFIFDGNGNLYVSPEKDQNTRYALMARRYNELKKVRGEVNGNYTPKNCEKLKNAIFSFYDIANETHDYEVMFDPPSMGDICFDFSKVLTGLDSYIKGARAEAQISADYAEIESAMATVYGAKELYGVSIGDMKWGVSKGQHVTHISLGEEDFIEIPPDINKRHPVEKVTQRDAYNTLSDSKTEKMFRELVERSANDYLKYSGNEEYKAVLQNVKNYVTASHRATQQEALVALNRSIASMKAKWTKNPPLEGSPEHEMLKSLDFYSGRLMEFTNGSLELPENEKPRPGDPRPEEPADAGLGHLGRWARFEGPIFPHEPSPNDIKQGRVNDCFMMAPLIKIANDHPEKIREAIRDNGDGTVSVRFFDRRMNRETNNMEKVPVYIRVNKTVKKALTGQHIYSSSSPWVQMVEKAYAVYATERNPDRKEEGFQLLDRGNPHDFLNAFDQDSTYVSSNGMIGYNDSHGKERYNLNTPKPEKYSAYENALFKLLSRTNTGEAMTVGTDPEDPARDRYISSVGIHKKHAYALLGTFEKDGKKYVQIQDPYASFRAGYDKNGNLVSDSNAIFATLNAGGTNMGKFNLELGDFLRTFDSITGMTREARTALNDLQKAPPEDELEKQKEEEPVREDIRPTEEDINTSSKETDSLEGWDEPSEEEIESVRKAEPAEEEKTSDFSRINKAREDMKASIEAYKNGELDVSAATLKVKDRLAEVIASCAILDTKKKLEGVMSSRDIESLMSDKIFADTLALTAKSPQFEETCTHVAANRQLLDNFLNNDSPDAVKALYDIYVKANQKSLGQSPSGPAKATTDESAHTENTNDIKKTGVKAK